MTKEEILDKHLSPYLLTMEDISKGTTVIPVVINRAMEAYALEEMTRLIRNMQTRPIECYSQKVQGQEKQFFLGSKFCDNLIEALKKQYL